MWPRIKRRIKEPSTWAGLAALFGIAAQYLPVLLADQEFARAFLAFLATLSALVAVVKKDVHPAVVIAPVIETEHKPD